MLNSSVLIYSLKLLDYSVDPIIINLLSFVIKLFDQVALSEFKLPKETISIDKLFLSIC